MTTAVFTAIPFAKGSRPVTVQISPSGEVSLPPRKTEDGRSFPPTVIGNLDPEVSAAVCAAVTAVYDALKALKAARAAEAAAAGAVEEGE